MALPLDKEGFLTDRSCWNERVAVELAAREGIELTAAHWQILRIAREFHAETGVVPEMRPLVKLARERIGADAGQSLYLLRLFPGSPAKLVAKIAGLPRPLSCL